MKELENIYFKDQGSFRNWLKKNHDKSPGVWMTYYKKHTDKECIEYREALEEALCFGWIDSIIKKVDNDRYVRKFTPRTNISNWSDLNKRIVLSMIGKGKMTEAGLQKIDVYLKTGKIDWENKGLKGDAKDKEFAIPDYILKAFAENEPALTNFNTLASSYKRHFVLWISSAKREETIQKRLRESIQLLKENKKLGLK
ncbi:YdeI/OmpD-associated family protein [Prolixibacteraceae bacterium Z1-6]|uniref:YdeI/OmpD-associated family protein n=1 Tax=Draconibacterium aestuarii TaxID=2998507 RepID=A0A9X3J6K9_9BACT|nr:YdeI/OmpD-associated family protein [Prolixibacteraceae bacterium Z1-6]